MPTVCPTTQSLHAASFEDDAHHPTALGPARSPSALDWARLPSIRADLCADVQAQVREASESLTAANRQALGSWFQHALRLGWMDIKTLVQAFSSALPQSALNRAYIDSQNALATRLEEIVQAHSLGAETDFDSAIHVFLIDPIDETAQLVVACEGFYVLRLDALRTLPRRIARLVHRALRLIDRAFVSCTLPGDVWLGMEYTWHHEELLEEYAQLRASVDLRDPYATAAYVRDAGFFIFSDDPHTVTEQVALAQSLRLGPPPWVRTPRTCGLVTEAKHIQALAHQYTHEYGLHRWLAYCEYVAACVQQEFADDRAAQRALNGVGRFRTEYADMQVGLHCGLLVTSGERVEHEHHCTVTDMIWNTGEEIAECYALTIASGALDAMLRRTATGIGLLLRAHAVNEHTQRPRP